MHKLSVVRWSIFVQKISALSAYGCIAALRTMDARFSFPSLCLFSSLVLSGCALQLSNITISIAVERDWTVCIAAGSSRKLGKTNTYLRQINLLCKLLAPLFVSFLTVKYDSRDDKPSFSIAVLAGISALTMVFELYWIQIVYHRFPTLAAEQLRKDNERRAPPVPSVAEPGSTPLPSTFVERLLSLKDWREFVRLPVFLSSVSISLLYLTVLSSVLQIQNRC
jgi:iron-regulated transporter 1